MQVLTGGFNAEYDNVRSGVVNIVTKEPRALTLSSDLKWSPAAEKYQGAKIYSADNYWDIGRFQSFGPTGDLDRDGVVDFAGWDAVWQGLTGPDNQPIVSAAQAKSIWDWQHRSVDGGDIKQLNRNGSERADDRTIDYSVGAPILRDRLSFLFSHREELTAYTWGIAVPSYRDRSVQGRLISNPTPSTKLTLGWVHSWAEGGKWGNFQGTYARGPRYEGQQFRSANTFSPGSGGNLLRITRNHGTFSWTHTLSPKTFYNISGRLGFTDFQHDYGVGGPQKSGVPAAAINPDGTIDVFNGQIERTSDGRILQTNIDRNRTGTSSVAGAVILDEGPVGFVYRPAQSDIQSLYRLRGGSGNNARAGDWGTAWETDWSVDMTSQITPNHQVKVGVQVHSHDLRQSRRLENL